MPPIRICIFAFLPALAAAAQGATPVDFQRDVQPIFAEHCTVCHGVDAAVRQANLRLDLRDAALKGGESGTPAIVPGKPEDSELILRITSTDNDLLMPPVSHQKPLSAAQIETLKRWIAEGAKYESHWAFVSPQKSPLPAVGTAHPVNAFVSATLQRLRLSPSPEAPPAQLCRRLYLDLIGLPPSPDELRQFEQRGYEATVDLLLGSERFGEKWARQWMDVARYSDTNGYEKDLPREQWAWRDWVIAALNKDMPYNQFVIEQIAGDLLDDLSPRPMAGGTDTLSPRPMAGGTAAASEIASPQQTAKIRQDRMIATGFLRNSMINEEGAIVPEQFRMVEMFDRIDCLGKAIIGLTTQCAQCHSHKFDPLTQQEYYGLFAFLNNTYEAQSWVYTPEQLTQREDIRRKISAAEDRLKSQRPNWQQEAAVWEADHISKRILWEPLSATLLQTISGLNHPTQEFDQSILMKGHVSSDVFLIASPKLDGVAGLRLEALNHRDLPHNGPGRSRLGTWGLQELEAYVKPPDAKDWQKLKLVNATADFSEPEQKQDDGKKSSGPVANLIDGNDQTTWNADRGIGRRNQSSVAVVQFEQPLTYPEGTELKIAWRNTDMLGCARFSITRQASPAAPQIDHAATLALEVPVAERSPEQHAAIFEAWRKSVPEAKPINDEIDALTKTLPVAGTSVLHLAERSPRDPRPTHLLDRGGWDQPLDEVMPHVPAVFHPLPEGAPQNRLGFARWLADAKSPFTARVAVNRIWQSVFGTGLVETSEDFGTRAPMPEYRDLLDWLAVDFMEHNWSRKHLIRTIVTSAAYRQSSHISPNRLETDPRNVWLARGPRFRADAEVVRDIALSVSGLITHKLGGPSVIPPVPQNVLDYNYTYPSYWKPAEGPERYRRTVYGFRKRSMPDPVMSNFDGPNGDAACARRVRSNTPLAALTALNEPVFNEAARALSLRVLREGGDTDAARADYAFLLCTSREPTEAERNVVLALLQSRRQRLAEGWLDINQIATGDPAKLPDLPPHVTPQDAAAWTLAARVLLNLDETMAKN